jgi:hypothetical protein
VLHSFSQCITKAQNLRRLQRRGIELHNRMEHLSQVGLLKNVKLFDWRKVVKIFALEAFKQTIFAQRIVVYNSHFLLERIKRRE